MEQIEEVKKNKETLKIFGYSIWRIFAYFIIYIKL